MNSKILVVDDEPDIRALLRDILEDEGYQVEVAGNAQQAEESKLEFTPQLILLDIWMPEIDGVTLLKNWSERGDLSCPVVMMSGHGTVETAVEATRYGAFDFVEKPLSMAKLLRTVKSALSSSEDAARQVSASPQEQPVGNSQQMQSLRQIMQSLAHNLSPVFLTGQPGAGVSIWANYLFGLQKEAAPRQTFQADMHLYQNGIFQNVFIDEITDLNMHSQRLLLSLLQQPVHPASTGRFIIASQHDYPALRANSDVLPELAEYWRQSIYIPTLDERIEDIPELLEYYVNWFNANNKLPYRHFGVAAQNLLRNHSWQGGLTELKAFVQQLLSNDSSDNVGLVEIRALLPSSTDKSPANGGGVLTLTIDLDLDIRQAREHFEREYLKRQLELCRYNVSELARKIGQERTNLYRKLKALGLHSRK